VLAISKYEFGIMQLLFLAKDFDKIHYIVGIVVTEQDIGKGY
jgi:hypothetical protein